LILHREDGFEVASVDTPGGLADGIDFVGVEGLEELTAAGEVAIESGHADSRASRNLGHRYVGLRVGEGATGGCQDLVAVALGVGTSRGCWELVRGH
jgi:hypothetical protein